MNDVISPSVLKVFQDITYNLAKESDDFDGAVHWSHYNGVFSALYALTASGGLKPTPDLVGEYIQVFDDVLPLTDLVYAVYESGGQSSVYEFVSQFHPHIAWGRCGLCERWSPINENACLVCGSRYA